MGQFFKNLSRYFRYFRWIVDYSLQATINFRQFRGRVESTSCRCGMIKATTILHSSIGKASISPEQILSTTTQSDTVTYKAVRHQSTCNKRFIQVLLSPSKRSRVSLHAWATLLASRPLGDVQAPVSRRYWETVWRPVLLTPPYLARNFPTPLEREIAECGWCC